ncbi:peptidoglycan-binding protein [Streptomyces sp. NPDC058001]|uniref:peptidoglycan-binding domain-containing protein n=1 Tax=Streptomyces sp. NPDC058001 TaxID=3346300 RepID=UPI0036E60061
MPTSDPDTPVDPTGPTRAEALEPTRVLRRRRPRTLAEMFYGERAGGDMGVDPNDEPDQEYEAVAAPHGRSGDGVGGSRGSGAPSPGPAATAPPTPAYPVRPRRVVIVVAVAVPALVALGIALLLTLDGDGTGDPATRATPSAVREPTADSDGPGTLREGNTGPAVTDLQERLRRIPDVYDPGTAVTGRYDATLTEAVARFQVWYGIRGDETGVYGDDTRLALESRTGGGPE